MKVEDMTTIELRKLLKISARGVGNSLKTATIVNELLKRDEMLTIKTKLPPLSVGGYQNREISSIKNFIKSKNKEDEHTDNN